MPTWQDEEGRIVVKVYGAPVKINERVRPWQLQEGEIAASTNWDYTIGGKKKIRQGVVSFFASNDSPGGSMFVPDAPTTSERAPWYPPPVGGQWASGAVVIDRRGTKIWRIRSSGYADYINTASPHNPGSRTKVLKAGLSLANWDPTTPGIPWNVHQTLVMHDAEPHPSGPTLTGPLFIAWNIFDIDPSTGTLWSMFDGKYYTDGYHHSWWTDIFKPTVSEIFQGRLWIANDQAINELPTGATVTGVEWSLSEPVDWKSGSDLRYSNLYEFAKFPIGTGGAMGSAFHDALIYVEPGLGGRITALKTIRSEDPALLVFKESAICMLSPRWGTGGGYMATSVDDLDTTESKITVLNSQIGCLAPKSIVEIPTREGTDFIFLASDGHIRRLSRAANDVPSGSGEPITFDSPDLVDRMSWGGMHRCSGVLWDNRYIISVPLDGAWYPSHIAIFDARTLALISIDVFTSQDIYSAHKWSGLKARPYLLVNKLANWSAPNVTIGPTGNMTTDTTPTGATVGYHLMSLYDPLSTRDPDDNFIEAIEDTQGFTFGLEDRKKRFEYFAAMLEPCTMHTGCLEVQYSIDGSSFSHLATLSIAQATTDLRPRKQKADLTDIAPDYFIQFRLKAKGDSRFSVAYIECAARLIAEETDNEIT